MVSWVWIPVCLLIGWVAGMFLTALCVAGEKG